MPKIVPIRREVQRVVRRILGLMKGGNGVKAKMTKASR